MMHLLNEVPISLLECPDQPRPQNNHRMADPMARTAQRVFILTGHPQWVQPWPEPSPSAKHQMNLYDYYQSYVLVCPGCGSLWCKSTCTNPPINTFSIRARWCEACMMAWVLDQQRLFEGRMVNSQHCPGTVLSFSNRLLGEGGDHDTWVLCLQQLPAALQQREVLLWLRLDSILNPSKETADAQMA